MQQRILRLDRLLDLQKQLAFAPHLLGSEHDPRPDRLVLVVGEARAAARVPLDEYLVPGRHELSRAGRGERHPSLRLLDLLHDSDPHRGTSRLAWLVRFVMV